MLEGPAAGCCAGAVAHRDAAGRERLDGSSVEGSHDGGRSSDSFQLANVFAVMNLDVSLLSQEVQQPFAQ